MLRCCRKDGFSAPSIGDPAASSNAQLCSGKANPPMCQQLNDSSDRRHTISSRDDGVPAYGEAAAAAMASTNGADGCTSSLATEDGLLPARSVFLLHTMMQVAMHLSIQAASCNGNRSITGGAVSFLF